MLEPTQIRVEYVARYQPGPDPAGDRLQLSVADQCANILLGAAELGSDVADCQGCGPFHSGSIASTAGVSPLAAVEVLFLLLPDVDISGRTKVGTVDEHGVECSAALVGDGRPGAPGDRDGMAS